jgi:hypothetical protein
MMVESGGAVYLKQIVDQRPAQVEVSEQDPVFGQVRLGQSQVHGGEGLALGGRWAADHDGVQRLQRLQVIQTRAQSPEFLGRGFMRTLQIEQVRLRGGLEGNLRHIVQDDRVESAGRGILLGHARSHSPASRSGLPAWSGQVVKPLGGASGAFPLSKFRTPACSARRKASCTRLILFLTLAKIVVVHRAAHGDGAYDDGSGPAQPEQAALTAHQQRVLQQRDAAQHRQVGVRADVFQFFREVSFISLTPAMNTPKNRPRPIPAPAISRRLGSLACSGREAGSRVSRFSPALRSSRLLEVSRDLLLLGLFVVVRLGEIVIAHQTSYFAR